MMPSGMGRLPGLDGLRALACLMVFGVHFQQATGVGGSFGVLDLERWLVNGNTGVALFFVLSGYVLTLDYRRALHEHRPWPPAWSFLVRRAARILPAYYACLAALAIKNRLWAEEAGWQSIGLHLLMAFNLDEKAIFRVNQPFWTLAVEAQFYLLLPALMALMRVLHAGAATLACVGLAYAAWVGYAAVMASMATGDQQAAVLVYSLPAHLPHFLIGCAAAAWTAPTAGEVRSISSQRRHDLVAVAVSMALLVVLATPLDDFLQIPWGRYNLPFVPLLLVVLVVVTPRSRHWRLLLEASVVRGIGVVSYGVYLFHLPVQNLTARVMASRALPPAEHPLLFLVASFVVTLIVATLSYQLLEQPVRHWVKTRLHTP